MVREGRLVVREERLVVRTCSEGGEAGGEGGEAGGEGREAGGEGGEAGEDRGDSFNSSTDTLWSVYNSSDPKMKLIDPTFCKYSVYTATWTYMRIQETQRINYPPCSCMSSSNHHLKHSQEKDCT